MAAGAVEDEPALGLPFGEEGQPGRAGQPGLGGGIGPPPRQGEENEVEMRSPLAGRVQQWRVREGQPVEAGDAVVLLAPDEAQVWEALRALYLIGEAEDLEDVELYARGMEGMPTRVQEQAKLTAEAIRRRVK